jgi:predicted outer membrane repeat protein/parallel beta-helix repeat protein
MSLSVRSFVARDGRSALVAWGFVLSITLAPPAFAASFLVGAGGAPEAPTLSAAVSVAADGDTLLLLPGTYVEVVETAKSLVVRASGTAGSAVINANNFGTALAFVGVTGSVRVEGIAFQNGDGERGGGLRLDGVTGGAVVENCEFFGNLAERTGGAIDAYDVVVEIRDCYFEGNGTSGASEQRGGALHLRGFNDGSVVEACTFTGNTAGSGGAIYARGSLTVDGCTFDTNSAAQGGAILGTSLTSLAVTNCVFEANTASGNGAGLSLAGSSCEIRDNLFLDNAAGALGGALYLGGGSDTVVERNLFDTNSAGKGGGLAVAGMLTSLAGNTFHAGSADTDGAALYIQQTSATIERNIFANCTGAAAVTCEVTANPNFTCSLVWNNAAGDFDGGCAEVLSGDGNFSEDPLFCDAGDGDFGVDADSPAAEGNEPPECLDEGIGWGPVNCGATPVVPTSWGTIKALFSER